MLVINLHNIYVAMKKAAETPNAAEAQCVPEYSYYEVFDHVDN